MAPSNRKVKRNKNSLSDKEWQEYNSEKYRYHSERNRSLKEDRRARERRRPAREALTEDQRGKRETVIQWTLSRKAAEHSRLKDGYFWGGGSVGNVSTDIRKNKNKGGRYYVAPFRYMGLVSDEHPILQAFVQRTARAGLYRPHTLMSGSTKAEVERGDSKLLGLDDAYVTANARMRGLIRIDLDADFENTDAVLDACDEANVPHPNIIVGHIDKTGRMLHPHLLYLLHDAVTFCGAGKKEFQALWHKVSRGLTYALAAAGADAGGLGNSLKTKNPLCPSWDRAIAAQQPYSLSYLSHYVELDVTDEVLFSARPDILARSTCPRVDPDKPSQQLFNDLRFYARDIAPERIAAGCSEDEFLTEIIIAALEIAQRTETKEADARRTAISVAQYCWNKARNAKAKLSAEELHERQKTAAQETAESRRSTTLNALVLAYEQLQYEGEKPTQKAVATASGKHVNTVKRHWKDVLEHISNEARTEQSEGTISSVSVKKPRSVEGVSRDSHTEENKISAEQKKPKPPDFSLITLNRNQQSPTSARRREDLYRAWQKSKDAA